MRHIALPPGTHESKSSQSRQANLIGCRALLASSCAALSLAAASPPAYAQVQSNSDKSTADSQDIGEIIVTARKQSETIQNIPASVASIGATELARAHVTRIDDLGNIVSNVNITTRADQTPDVVLRGVGTFGSTNGTGVGFYSDDVQLYDGQTVQPFDLDRIEVLKGPQGTLYGGNNIGGAIKYVTKLPGDRLEGLASAEYGSYGNQLYTAALSGPIDEHAGLRVSAYHSFNGGYIRGVSQGNRKLDRGKEYGGRVTLQLKDDDTTAVLYVNADRLRTGASSLYYRPDTTESYSLDVENGTRTSLDRDLYSVNLSLEHRLGDGFAINSISSYFHSKEEAVADIDKSRFAFLIGFQRFNRNVWSQELRLSKSTGNLRFVIGAFAQGNEYSTLQDNLAFNAGPPPAAGTVDPEFGDPNYDRQTTLVKNRQREFALFGNFQYDLGKLTAELGLRGDYNRVRTTDELFGLANAVKSTQFLPKLSLSYHFSDKAMLYGLVSRGYQAAGNTENFDASNQPFLLPFTPETVWNYEAGLKLTLPHRARFNVAVFYLDYRNRLFPSFQFQGAQFVQTTTNIGGSNNYGIEADLAIPIVKGLVLNLSGGITEAKWRNIIVGDPDHPIPVLDGTGNPVIDDNGDPVTTPSLVNLKGRTAPFTPAYQGTASLDWTHSISHDWTFGFRGSVTVIGRQYWDVTDNFKQRPYQLVNLGVRLEYKTLTLAANVFNVFDVRYNTTFISAAEVGAPRNVAGIGRPRLANVSLGIKF